VLRYLAVFVFGMAAASCFFAPPRFAVGFAIIGTTYEITYRLARKAALRGNPGVEET
jgi:hypothetical protein